MKLDAWLILVVLIILGLAGFVTRVWLKSLIERSVRFESDKSLESVKSDLRSKEEKLNNLQIRLLDGRAGLYTWTQNRRVQAIENLWKATIRLDAFRFSATMLTVLNLPAIEKRISSEPKLQKLTAAMSGGDLKDKIKDIGGEEERLFLPTETWKLFDTYKLLLLVCYMRLSAVSLGMEDTDKMFDLDSMLKKMKEVMPHFSDFLDQNGLGGAARLVDPLREVLFESLRGAALTGGDDQQYAEQMTIALKTLDDILAKHAASQAV